MIDAGQCGVDGREGLWSDGTRYHDHRDAKRAGGGDLAVTRRSAAVLGDDCIDAVGGEQRRFVLDVERTPGEKLFRMLGQRRRFGRLDAAHEVAVLWRRPEGGDLLPAHRDEDAPWRGSESGGGPFHVGHLDPVVFGLAYPAGSAKPDKGYGSTSCGGSSVGRDARRERVRRVDENADLLLVEPATKAARSAETADAHRAAGKFGRPCAAGEGVGEPEARTGEAGRELAGFGSAAENEDMHAEF